MVPKYPKEVKTRPLTLEEKQAFLDMGAIGLVVDDANPMGRPATLDDIKDMTKVIAARNIDTGKWIYYE